MSASVEEIKRQISLLKQEVNELKSLVESSANMNTLSLSSYTTGSLLFPKDIRPQHNKQYMLRNNDPMEWRRIYIKKTGRADYNYRPSNNITRLPDYNRRYGFPFVPRYCYNDGLLKRANRFSIAEDQNVLAQSESSEGLLKGQKQSRNDILISPLVNIGQDEKFWDRRIFGKGL